jgi:hypothetical protein
VLVVGGIALAVAAPEATEAVVGPLLCMLVVLVPVGVVVVALVIGVNAIIDAETECPECKLKRARIRGKETIIDQKKGWGWVTRRASSHTHGRISGTGTSSASIDSTTTTSWQERARVIVTTYQVCYECKLYLISAFSSS